MYRIFHIAASFGTVLVAYWCYALVAVPLIEPPPKRLANNAGASATDGTAIHSQSVRRDAELKAVFPPGSWEIENDTIKLQNDQLRLLFKKYDNQGGGLVKLTPCTMVFMADDEDDSTTDGNQQRAPVIMQVPDGALLKFDKALDLKMAKIGKLIGGRLLGRVTVFSHGSEPGEEDDFIFVTNDLLLRETEAQTSQRVQFRYGPHYGSGHNMLIKLEQAKGKATSQASKGPQIEGISSLEIKHIEEFHLEIPDDDDKSTGHDPTTGELAAGGKNKADTLKGVSPKTIPIEINCQGPFRIDLQDNVITFEEQVDVMRFYPEGPSDQINCELLSVYLMPKEKTNGKKANVQKAGTKKKAKNRATKQEKPGLDKLEPRRIVALGSPVVVRSPNNKVEARGNRLEYDMKNGQIVLDGRLPKSMIAAARKKAGKGSLPGLHDTDDNPTQAFLRQGPNEIHAVDLQYEPAESRRQIGKLVAQGPGWFRGVLDDKQSGTGKDAAEPLTKTNKNKPPQILEASWQGLLRLQPDYQYKSILPDDKFHAISMSGNTKLSFPGMGLESDEVHFWMIEPRAPDKETQSARAPQNNDDQKAKPPALKPHSMMACGKDKGRADPSEMKKVKINSPQMTGVVDKLQVWFEEDPDAGTYKPRMGAPPTTQVPTERAKVVPANQTTTYYPPDTYPNGTAVNVASAPQYYPTGQQTPVQQNMFAPRSPNTVPAITSVDQIPNNRPQNNQPKNHFHVVAKLLNASVTLGKKAELAKLTITGEVRLEETKTAKPDEEPVVVEGDQIVVRNASRPHATMIVTGSPIKPARFQGRGLTLTGANINLNRGINRLWMDCPGTMTLPPVQLDTDGQEPVGGTLPARPEPNAEPMTVHWQDRMEFDGRTITFEQSVLAKNKQQMLQTETLKVSLDRMVNFDQTSGINGRQEEQPKVQEVHCRGGVVMESSTFDDESGKLTSTELMQVANLKINNISGNIYADGPGMVTTVRLRSSGMGAFGNLPGEKPKAPKTPREVPFAPPVGNPAPDPITPIGYNDNENSGEKKEGLIYLKITFQNHIEGNRFQRKIDFHDQVKAVYGPVENWQDRLPDDNPDAVGPQGAILSCRKLSVTSMPTPTGKRQNIELQAAGNTLIEGMLFTARGAVMSYNQDKDLMILEGDGRNPATLYRQEVIGGPEQNLHAQRIKYWPGTKEIKVVGAQSVELLLDQNAQDPKRRKK
ncbi:MAG: hypothetical protein JXM70_11465 [Pirellulales bacterium]|nr:hypothetical protein [Pirellulales bacterium]